MRLSHLITGTALAAGVGLATYLTISKQDPLTWGRHVKQQAKLTTNNISNVKDAKEQLGQSARNLATAIEDAQPALDEIQSAVDKFSFKIAPRLEVIESTLDRMNSR